MPLRLRISLPDRPGMLGQVTRALGLVGADIVQVTVLEREAGRVVDEFSIAWPEAAPRDRLTSAFRAMPGVKVEGVWTIDGVPDAFPDLDLLGHVAVNPDQAIKTLVDAVPKVFNADWAAALVHGRGEQMAHASWQAPRPLGVPDLTPVRPIAFSTEETTHHAAAPIGTSGVILLLTRQEGPIFHRAELLRLRHLLDIFVAVVHGKRPSALTSTQWSLLAQDPGEDLAHYE
jgi:hypothetical protein